MPVFWEKEHPDCYLQKEVGTIETIGETDMTEGEMLALLEQRIFINARIYHKGNIWH